MAHASCVEVRKRGDDQKYEADVLARGVDCDLALLTVRDEAFWAALSGLNVCISVLDEARRWGLGCRCHEEALKLGKRVFCVKKGRRLPEAPVYLQDLRKRLERLADTYQLAWCRFSNHIYPHAVSLLRRAASQVPLKLGWPQTIPWAFASALTPEACQELLRHRRMRTGCCK